MAAAGVLVAGVVAALVIPALGGSPGDKDKASPSSSSSATTDGTPSTPPPTVAGTARPPTLPEGSRTEAGMYAWVPPEGWERVVQSGAEVHYTSPDRKQEILANAAPARGDLMDQWTKTEKETSKGLDYQRIRLEETTFRDAPAVVWEYTVTAKGLPWHARLLGFNADGKYYEITTWYRPDIRGQRTPGLRGGQGQLHAPLTHEPETRDPTTLDDLTTHDDASAESPAEASYRETAEAV